MKKCPFYALALCSLFIAIGCSHDPHKVVIDGASKENFSTLVKDGSGLTGDEVGLLKAAESRIRKSQSSDKVVGKTIADVIADQKRWQADHEQLTRDLEPLYRAGKAIQASIDVGVNYARYGELVQAFATELTVANDKVSTDEERRVVGLFHSALQAYQDASTLWQHQINNTKYDDLFLGGVAYSIKNQIDNPALMRIVDTYHLPLHNGQLKYGQGPFQSLPKNTMQIVWVDANKTLNRAVGAYLSK